MTSARPTRSASWTAGATRQLLALAAEEERVMITFDVKDFPDIARRWAEAGRPHAGLAIVVGIDHGEFGTILRVLERPTRGALRPEPVERVHLLRLPRQGGLRVSES